MNNVLFFPFQNRNHKVLNVFNFFLIIKTDSTVWGRSFKVQRISLKKLIKFPNSRYWNIVYSIQVLLKGRGWNWARYAWSCIEEYYVHLSCVIRWWNEIEKISRTLIFVFLKKAAKFLVRTSLLTSLFSLFQDPTPGKLFI